MAHTPFDFIFQDAAIAAANGNACGNAQGMRYAKGAGANRNLYPWYMKIRMTAFDSIAGGTVTFLIQDSPDNVTYTTRLTETVTIPTAKKLSVSRLFKTAQPYVRVRVNAVAGGAAPTADAYGTLGSFGR